MIKQLREATGAGVLDCRKALEQADGDFNKAVDFLREKGLATAPSAPAAWPKMAWLSSIPTAMVVWA